MTVDYDLSGGDSLMAGIKGKPLNPIYIERELRKGRTPEELGAERIGQGAQKAAYRIGNMVIKKDTGGYGTGSKRPPREIRNFGARAARQWRAGGWIIQEYVTPIWQQKGLSDKVWLNIRRLYRADLGDLHQGNMGYSPDEDMLVVFDW